MPSKGYAKELLRQRHGREVEDLLRDLYVVKRHTQAEIAAALGISRSTVVDWLNEYSITREDRPPVVIEGAAAL